MKASSIFYKESLIVLSRIEVEKKFGSKPEKWDLWARMLNKLNLGTQWNLGSHT
jgi:hypothetical protein